MLDADLLEILRCPIHPDGPPLEPQNEPSGEWLVCLPGSHKFPVVDDIPHLLPEDGVAL